MRNAEATRIISNGPSLDTLGELMSIWEGLIDNASSWSRELTQRATALDADLARLDIMTEIWNMTANEARAKNAPQEVLDRVAQTVGLIQQTQNSIKSSRADILSLQSRLAAEKTRIQIALSTVQQAKQGALNRLLGAPREHFIEANYPAYVF
jgi:hypothetical protein